MPLCRRFDVIGPMARTVEDCAQIMAVLVGKAAVDLKGATGAGLRPDGGWTACRSTRPRKVPSPRFRPPWTGWVRRVQRSPMAGSEIVDKAMALSPRLFAPEAYGIWRAQIRGRARTDVVADSGPLSRRAPRSARRIMWRAGETLNRLRREWAAKVAGFDAILLPTTPNLPPDAQRLMDDEDYFVHANLLTLRNTRIGNLLGLPAITLPTSHPGCGIMAMGHVGGDRHLLRVGAGIEVALGVG